MSFDKMAVLNDYPKLNKLFNHWAKLHRITRDSWPWLFRTKKHKRRVIRCEKMVMRFQRAVEKELNIEVYSVRRLPDIGYTIMWDADRNEP